MNELGVVLVVQQAFGLVVLLLLPLVAAGVLAASIAGMLAARVGLQDPTVALVARALAVVLAVGVMLESLSGDTLDFTIGVWDRLGEVGRVRAP